MLALCVFLLRVSAGMIGCLLLLSSSSVNPRYFRTHFLSALALAGVTWIFIPSQDVSWTMRLLLLAAMVVAFLGSITYSLENAPGGRVLAVLETGLLAAALVTVSLASAPPRGAVALVGDATSALFLGATLSAMLMGHMYLIAPTMSLTPLFRLLIVAAVALLGRLMADSIALWFWTESPALGKVDNEKILLMTVRWLVGFLGPAILGWMAWLSARIRSTQSATGILYVVVILCFLGELTSLLLRNDSITL